MAIKKNKDGIMAAISAATAVSNVAIDTRERAQRSLPKGTIGSVRAGLGGIQEIETKLILPWGPPDRLETELTAVNNEVVTASISELADSISDSEQQVPVLLRPSKDKDGHFEVVYGRRRILACKKLGISVKALIRTLDDREALMAKGLENSSRSDLSYYERARFASAIIEQGYDRATACRALSVSKNTLSQLERLTRLVPDVVGDAIGPAPESGRPKWMRLAGLFETGEANDVQCFKLLGKCSENTTSDDYLGYLITEILKANKKPKKIEMRRPIDGVKIKSDNSLISVSVKRVGKNAAFAEWLDEEIENILKDSFERFKAQNN